MIEVFRITHNIYDRTVSPDLPLNERTNTRGNHYKLQNHTFHYDSRKHFFSARIVNIWNSLPNSVVDACTVNAFKSRLDNFWKHQSVKFDFTAADLTGTRNRSEEVIKWYCLFMIVYNYDADLEVSDTCVRSSLLSWVEFITNGKVKDSKWYSTKMDLLK